MSFPPRGATQTIHCIRQGKEEKKRKNGVGMVIRKCHPKKRSEADGCEIAFSPPRGVTPFFLYNSQSLRAPSAKWFMSFGIKQ